MLRAETARNLIETYHDTRATLLRLSGERTALRWALDRPYRRDLEVRAEASLRALGALLVAAVQEGNAVEFVSQLARPSDHTGFESTGATGDSDKGGDEPLEAGSAERPEDTSPRDSVDDARPPVATEPACLEAAPTEDSEGSVDSEPQAGSLEPTSRHGEPETVTDAAPTLDPIALSLLQAKLRDGGSAMRQRDRPPSKYGTKFTESAADAFEAIGSTDDELGRSTDQASIARWEELLCRALPVWATLPAPQNRELTAWATVRLRALQEQRGLDPLKDDASDFKRAIGLLVAHSESSRPGSIYGLARNHRPKQETWAQHARNADKWLVEAAGVATEAPPEHQPTNFDEALRVLNKRVRGGGLAPRKFVAEAKRLVADGLSPVEARLVNLAYGYLDALDAPELRRLKKAVVAEMKQAEVEADAEHDAVERQIPTTWPGFELTRGKKALLLGGDPRPERTDRIKREFDFESLEWVPDTKRSMRGVDSTVQRMRNGTVDVVIVLRAFISHKASDKVFAARRDSPCLVALADTYGVSSIRQAIDRFGSDDSDSSG